MTDDEKTDASASAMNVPETGADVTADGGGRDGGGKVEPDWPRVHSERTLRVNYVLCLIGVVGVVFATCQMRLSYRTYEDAQRDAERASKQAEAADARTERSVAAFEKTAAALREANQRAAEVQRARIVVSFVDRLRPDADNTITVEFLNAGNGVATGISAQYDIRSGTSFGKPTYPKRFHIGAPATLDARQARRISALGQFPDRASMLAVARDRARKFYLSVRIAYSDQFGARHSDESSFTWSKNLDDWIPCDARGCDAEPAGLR